MNLKILYKYITQHKGSPQVIVLIPNLLLPNADKSWTSNIEYLDNQSFLNWQFITSSCSEQNLSPIKMLTFFCFIKIFCNILCEYIIQLAIISKDIQGGDKWLGHQIQFVVSKQVYLRLYPPTYLDNIRLISHGQEKSFIPWNTLQFVP